MNTPPAKQRNHTESLVFEGSRYERYIHDEKKNKRGSLVFLDGDDSEKSVAAYPHIKRIYRLEKGIRHYFKDKPFFVEEKMDGYNIRIVSHQGQLLAISRGGIICPFTTEWLNIWSKNTGLYDFFKEYPERVLCVECLGDNPYNSKRDFTMEPGLHFFCFDIALADGSFLSPSERYRVLKQYKIPSVPSYGAFTIEDLPRLKSIIIQLNQEEREGVVLKSFSEKKTVKFVTPRSDMRDFKEFLIYAYDIEPGFYTSRLLRSALFVQELGLDEKEYSELIGKAVIEGYAPLKNYQGSYEEFRIYVKTFATWEALSENISSHIPIKTHEISPAKLNGEMMIYIVFRRYHKRSTRRYQSILKGHGRTD